MVYAQRNLERCDWRNPVKLIKYINISPRRFSPKLRPVCEMLHTVFKVVFDGVYISSTISLIWRTKIPNLSIRVDENQLFVFIRNIKIGRF
jgi:hypothetical protein